MKSPPKFAVLGHPIAHSLSPQIHAHFAELQGNDLVYERVDVSPAQFTRFVRGGYQSGYAGFNVTLPHKQQALALASQATQRCRDAGAANTLTLGPGERIRADNTDGIGLVRDLKRLGVQLARSRLIVIGAGGAARGILPALIDAGVAELHVGNRTLARATELCTRFSGRGTQLSSHALNSSASRIQADGLIQATAGGHQSAAPWECYRPGSAAWCYDLSYGNAATAFLAWAKDQGVSTCADGLGMLVEQAAAAFEVWHGVLPATRPVLSALQAAIGE